MHENFGVRMIGPKRMSTRNEVFSQSAVIVDFAVEDHEYRTVFVRHGLVPTNNVDNRQSAMSEKDMIGLIFVKAFAVRASMPEYPRHFD
jgi:hypothetical protein